ncbi:MAG: ThuA domain-containing protein [Anaerolineales bacterium]|nr:ThuA domain-containing protein [Anaerolineales bacterium]
MANPRALLLTHGGHGRLPNNRAILEELLVRQAQLDVLTDDENTELTAERLTGYALIINYSGYRAVPEVTEEQVTALADAVAGGKPYIALHVATLPWKAQLDYMTRHDGWPDQPAPDDLLSPAQLRYLEMTGSAFVGHPPIAPFLVRITNRAHLITAGVEDFEIEDELYQLGGDQTALQVLAEAGGQPLLYTRQWGQGRVHYNALGHDQRALNHPSYQRLLVQAVRWALAPA